MAAATLTKRQAVKAAVQFTKGRGKSPIFVHSADPSEKRSLQISKNGYGTHFVTERIFDRDTGDTTVIDHGSGSPDLRAAKKLAEHAMRAPHETTTVTTVHPAGSRTGYAEDGGKKSTVNQANIDRFAAEETESDKAKHAANIRKAFAPKSAAVKPPAVPAAVPADAKPAGESKQPAGSVQVGARGGKYIMTKSGQKFYVTASGGKARASNVN